MKLISKLNKFSLYRFKIIIYFNTLINNKKNMKIKLLIFMCIGFFHTTYINAQMQAKQQDVLRLKYNRNDGFNFFSNALQRPHFSDYFFEDRAIVKIPFTGSRNILSVIVSESNCLTANQQLNAVMFTHRISNEHNPPNVNSGFIQSTFTTNYGTNWDSIILYSDQVNFGRFPSGAIFNPPGNTDINNAFATVSGPIATGAGWGGNCFSSAKLDHTNINPHVDITGTSGVINQAFVRIGYTATDLKTIVIGGLYLNPNAGTPTALGFRGATLNYATPAANNTFNWSIDSIVPNFAVNSLGIKQTNTVVQTAWNKAGNIGYMIFNGVEASITDAAAKGYCPIVYKTINAGQNWSQLPNFNFSTLPSIAATLQPTWNSSNSSFTGPPKAWFSQEKGYDCAVDQNDELHIFCTVVSGFSMNDDSLALTFAPSPLATSKISYMFDTYTSGNTWGARLVDSLLTENALNFSPFTDDVGSSSEIDARLQISRSDDGSKLFYFWVDTYPNINDFLENNLPNIFGKAYDVSSNLWSVTKQFTTDNRNYFMYVSNLTLQSGSTYKVPVTVSLPVYWPFSALTSEPFRHYFVSGIEFEESEFTVTSAPQGTLNNSFSLGEFYPNPGHSTTSIVLNLEKSSEVTIDLFDALGRKVSSISKGQINEGKNNIISLNLEALNSGVYQCIVSCGDEKITKKLVINH